MGRTGPAGHLDQGSEEPLQRPSQYADKEFFTDEERAALDKQRAEIINREAAEDRRKRGTEQDVAGAYNAAVFTSHLQLGRRTSLISDPPNGRIPPLTPEAQKKQAEMREFAMALLQATEVCKNKLPLCAAGKYGPPSPRRAEVPPIHHGRRRRWRRRDQSLRRPGGAWSWGALHERRPARFRRFPSHCAVARTARDFLRHGAGTRVESHHPGHHGSASPSEHAPVVGGFARPLEGKTLVVDVTNFSPKSNFQGSHENLHLVERWTRLDADTLEYTVRIEDPTVWTAPWTATHLLKKQSDEANRIYYEPRCHEGNYGMPALLAGARADERAFAQGRGPDPATVCVGACGGFAAGFSDDGEDANPLR
jgi:hypothetical protein